MLCAGYLSTSFPIIVSYLRSFPQIEGLAQTEKNLIKNPI